MMAWALFRTFVRSFFLQALWNYERMQNVGFAFSMEPLLRRAHRAREAFTHSLRRHAEYFNVHPYFAPIVMGVIFHKEKSMDESKRLDDPTLTILKNTMGGAFGAVGDHVIWGTWRPFCAVMALSVGLLVGYPVANDGAAPSIFNPLGAILCAEWWVVGFLSMFNSIHIWLRWRGLQKAAVDGPLVVRWVESLHLQKWAAQIRRVGLLFLFTMVLVYFSRWAASEMLIWMIAVLLGSAILKRWRLSTFVIFYLVCGVSVAMTQIGIHWP
jgi:mannose/fructose/N-acetylgalactosamine-specific phosphotransferase system component IID